MTVIRVLPQGTSGAYAATTAATQALYTQALQNQKDTDSMKLQYQNALWEEKLQNTQLSSQLQYTSALAPYGLTMNSSGQLSSGVTGGLLGAGTLGGLGSTGVLGSELGGIGLGGLGSLGSSIFGGLGSLGGYTFGGGGASGQTNVTNQSSPSGADQSVVNNNSTTASSPVMAWPQSAWNRTEGSFSRFFNSL